MSSIASVGTHSVDHHGEHGHHHESFWTKYVFSQDHKMIAKQFLITGIVMAVFAMILSILFRMQLAWPDKEFPILEVFLGKWAEGRQNQPGVFPGTGDHSRYHHGIFCAHRGTQRNVCQLVDSVPTRCAGYGIAIYEHAVLLVFLWGLRGHDFVVFH